MNDKSQSARYYDEQRNNTQRGATRNTNNHRATPAKLIPVSAHIRTIRGESRIAGRAAIRLGGWPMGFKG